MYVWLMAIFLSCDGALLQVFQVRQAQATDEIAFFPDDAPFPGA